MVGTDIRGITQFDIYPISCNCVYVGAKDCKRCTNIKTSILFPRDYIMCFRWTGGISNIFAAKDSDMVDDKNDVDGVFNINN